MLAVSVAAYLAPRAPASNHQLNPPCTAGGAAFLGLLVVVVVEFW